MSNIVENNVKPSGPPVVPFAGLLPGIPSQPTAKTVPDEWCTGCNRDHNPDVCGYRPEGEPTAQLSRLVPAKVGRSGRVQTVHLPCPEWCIVDHLVRVTCLEDVMHFSDADSVTVLTLTDDDTAHSAVTVTIGCDPAARDPRLRAAHILANSGQAEDACLTPDMGDELADELIAFAAQIRHKVRIVRLHNAAEGQA